MPRSLNKRDLLKLGAGTLLAGSVAPALGASSGNVLTREDYQRYLDLFNANDPRFIEYYHPDVEFELGATQMKGAENIRDFYANVKRYIKEEVTCTEYVADETTVAVEIPTRFECIEDWEDSFWGVPLKKGQVMRIITFGFYKVRDRRFIGIKTARYRVVNDWRMESV
jgi:hypothetical protein